MKMDRTELSGLIVLFVGAILLAFTFFNAYGFLSGSLSILTSADLTQLFGNAMAPLIEAVIRILYLGIMGWIGSILTIRGVQLLKLEKETAPAQPQMRSETKQPANQAKADSKPDVKESKKTESAGKTPIPEPPKETEKEIQTK